MEPLFWPSASRMSLTRLALRWGPLMLALAATLFVYLPLTRVYFWGDDFSHFAAMRDKGLLQFYLDAQGGHLYLVRNVFFCLPYLLFGLKAEPYGWLALSIHLINVALFYKVVVNLCREELVAGLGAAWWGTCPVLNGALGDFCVNGHALVATALLLALELLTRRTRLEVSTRTAVTCAAFLFMGAASFGVGLGIALAFPVAVLLLARRPYRRRGAALAFALLPLVVSATYFGRKWLYVHLYGPEIGPPVSLPDIAHSVIVGFFDLSRRIAHYFRASLAGLTWTLGTLSNLGQDSGELTPTAMALGISLLVAGWLLGTSKVRATLAGLALLAASAYAVIALRRWGEVATVARYHYVGAMLVGLMLSVCVAQVAEALRLRRALPALIFLAGTLFTYAAFTRSGWRVDERRACRAGVEATLRRIDAAIDAQPPGADVDLPVEVVPDCWMWDDVHKSAGMFVITHASNSVRGHRVRFWTSPEELAKLPRSTRRFGSLLYARSHEMK